MALEGKSSGSSDSSSSSSSDANKLNVDICATLLTKDAPKLPLREELPSLGFEVVYHASGVGVRASRQAAKKAARSFRKREEVRDLKKRRFFPKSSKRIRQKLAERKRMELEIKHSTSAVTYETYDKELQPKSSGDTSSSWTSSSGAETSSDSDEGAPFSFGYKGKLFSPAVKARKRWGLLRGRIKTLGNKEQRKNATPPKSIHVILNEEPEHEYKRKNERLEDIIGEAAFPDYLAPLGSTGLRSKDPSSLSTPQGGLPESDGKMKFVNSPETKALLPGILATDESEDGSLFKSDDEDDIFNRSVKNAMAAFDSAVEATLPDFLTAIDNAIDLDNEGRNPLFPATSQEPPGKSTQSTGAGSSPDPPAVINVLRPGEKHGGEKTKQEVDDAVKDAFANIEDKLHDDDESEKEEQGSLFDTIKQAFTSCDEYDSPDENDEGAPVSPKSDVAEETTVPTERGPEEEGEAWLATAKLAFENIATDIYKATGMAQEEKKEDENEVENHSALVDPQPEPVIAPEIPPDTEATPSITGSIESLFLLLSDTNGSLQATKTILGANPEFVQVRRQQDARLPLHTLCDRGLPDRSSIASDMATYFYLKDVDDFKEILVFVQGLHSNACLVQDARGDLPVHLLARTFMRWEAQWYETVYQEAAMERDTSGKTSGAITKLYQTMSECIEILLLPLIPSASLCHLPGSIGNILPLHIAAIFTSSVTTLRRMLEAYPGAAGIPCDLDNLKTFVPDQATPLELHDLLSTDFPKWEIAAKQEENPEIKWSQSHYLRQGSDDCIRRSDLLFAYHQMAPYRFEKSRIRRLESRLQYEAKQVVQNERKRMSEASELIWIWICTFREPKTGAPTYVNSVKRVVAALPLRSVRYLASVETKMGKQVIDTAISECSKAIRRRLEQLTETIVPISESPQKETTEKSSSTASSSILKSWDDTQSVRLSRTDRGLVSHLCRLLFNVEEWSYPTAFVILPYRLMLTDDGVLGIESAESAAIAVKFADHLLQLTDPRSILYYLDSKSERYYGESLYGSDENPARLAAYETIQSHAAQLLTLYEEGAGYLYLIDEVSGMPILSSSEEVYPIVLSDSVSLVQKLLPLMLVGMLQMRGEKALSVLMTVLLDDSVCAVTPKWIEAAKEVGAYLYSQRGKEAAESSEATAATDDIVQFISSSSSKMRNSVRPKNGTSEWNVELSILKMLIDMNDPEHCYHGLKPLEEAKGLVLWTVPETISHSPSSQTSGTEDTLRCRPSGPVDLDEASLARSYDSDEISLMKRRRQSGPVDLDESIDSDDDSGLDLENLASKHAELSKIHARMRSGTETKHKPASWIVKSAYSSDSSSEESFCSDSDGSSRILHSRSLPALDSLSLFEHSFQRPERMTTRQARFNFLFDELAIESYSRGSTPNQSFDDAGWDYGERVRSEMTFQLDNPSTVCSEVNVLQLKVGVAEEGRRLSKLNRRLLDLRDKECLLLQQNQSVYDNDRSEWRKHGLNTASKTRELIIRLQDLEDRILVDQVEMQHLSLGLYALTEGINLLHPTEVYTKGDDSSSFGSSHHSSDLGYRLGTSADVQSEIPSEYQANYYSEASRHQSVNPQSPSRDRFTLAPNLEPSTLIQPSRSEVSDLIETLRNPRVSFADESESSYGAGADYSPSEMMDGSEYEAESPSFYRKPLTSIVIGEEGEDEEVAGSSSEGPDTSFDKEKPPRLMVSEQYGVAADSSSDGVSEPTQTFERASLGSGLLARNVLPMTSFVVGQEELISDKLYQEQAHEPLTTIEFEEEEHAEEYSNGEDEEQHLAMLGNTRRQPLTTIEFHQEFDDDDDDDDEDSRPLTSIICEHSVGSSEQTANEIAESEWATYDGDAEQRFEI